MKTIEVTTTETVEVKHVIELPIYAKIKYSFSYNVDYVKAIDKETIVQISIYNKEKTKESNCIFIHNQPIPDALLFLKNGYTKITKEEFEQVYNDNFNSLILEPCPPPL